MSREIYLTPGVPSVPVVVPDGPLTEFVTHLYDNWQHDIAVRRHHTGQPEVARDLQTFPLSFERVEVWRDDPVVVTAVGVHHEPVEPAVAYRVDGPGGAVVISGDTRVCDEVQELATGADVLLHEAFRVDLLRGTRGRARVGR